MPYKYRTLAGGRRAYRKRRAASSIQRAWRARKRRKRGSLVARTALANRRAIKSIRKDVELKFANDAVASSRTNYCGQVMTGRVVDNYGMSQSSLDWVAAGGGATQLAAAKYCPLMINPIVVYQAGQQITTAPTPLTAATENSRIGNDIVMSHFTAKITMVGGSANLNGGTWANVVRKQKVTALLLLDREPAKMNPGLLMPAPTFDAEAISCQLYPRTPDAELAIPGSNERRFDALRFLPQKTANPPGLATGDDGSRSLESLSFYSKDNIMGKTGRFKVLKKVSLSCYQQSNAGIANTNGSSVKTTATKTVTLKGKYKFHFDGDTILIPGNQTILLCLYSDTPTVRSFGGAVPTDYCTPPVVTVVSRFSFRDP